MSRLVGLGLATALLGAGCWTGGTSPPVEPAAAASSQSQHAPRRPRPRRRAGACRVEHGPPVAATGLGTIRVSIPDGQVLTRLLIASKPRGGSATTRMQLGTSLPGTATVPPGIYRVEIGSSPDGRVVRCDDVVVNAGGETLITVDHLP